MHILKKILNQIKSQINTSILITYFVYVCPDLSLVSPKKALKTLKFFVVRSRDVREVLIKRKNIG